MLQYLLSIFWSRPASLNPHHSAAKPSNVDVGRWGEDMAALHLEGLGWRILERNSRPCRKDRRCELDIIAFIPRERKVVFVEVKTHRAHSPWAGRLWAVDRRKKRNLFRACANWLMRRRWHGCCRLDVIEIYGRKDSLSPPEIDHIENVPLFPPNWRFW